MLPQAPTRPYFPPPQGFILACPSSGTLKVCLLPPKARLDTPWVTTRIPLKATPHRLALHQETNLLAVAVSR